MKTQVFKTKRFWQVLIIIAIDALFFGLVNPNKVNSLFLIAGFILFGITLYIILQIFLGFLIKLGFKIKHRRKLAGFIVSLSCLLLALQSIGQLSIRDVLIILPLAVLLYIYAAHISPRATD